MSVTPQEKELQKARGACRRNASASNEAEYTFTASKDITVYANYSVSVIYNANGGTAKDGGELYTQKYSVVMYKCPNTLPDKGYFVRDGYTLVEYNTKADGSGTAVGLGSRIATDGESSMELYCIWKNNRRPPILNILRATAE